MTLDEWATMDEDEPGELVDGVLEEEEVPTVLHEAVVSWLLFMIAGWIDPLGGWVFASEHKLAVGPKKGRKPDLTLYLPGNLPPAKRASLGRRAPSAVVEVISPSPRDGRRDRVDKLREYTAFGVRHYWIIDPQLRTLEILELSPRKKPKVVLSTTGGVTAIPGCAALSLDLDALWARLDRLPDEEPTSPTRLRKAKRRR
jgi:Uma2 family endonuclease